MWVEISMKFLPSLFHHSFRLTQVNSLKVKFEFWNIFGENVFLLITFLVTIGLRCCAIRVLVGSTLPKFVSMTRGWEASGCRMCLMLARIWVSSGKETVSNKYELKKSEKAFVQTPFGIFCVFEVPTSTNTLRKNH